MTSNASFQWVCRAANPFAREVLSGFDEVTAAAADVVPGVAAVHAVPLSRCMRVLDALVRSSEELGAEGAKGAGDDTWGPAGRTVMIGAPRAGYGKTHLVARLRAATRGELAIVPLEFDAVETVSWQHLLRRVLAHFDATPASAADEASLWQETGRRFFAEAYLAAAREGGLDEGAPEADSEVLRREFARALSPTTASRLREWVLENCYRLGENAGPELCARWQIDAQALPMWIDSFRRSALETATADERAAMLRSLLPPAGDDAEAIAKARLGELLRVASTCRPLALVVDHLDGFYGRADAAMPLANILASLRDLLRRGVTLLCLNQDVWKSVFEGNLPSALIDRLSGEPAVLEKLSIAQARDLVHQRLDAAGAKAAQATTFVDLLAQREGWAKKSASEAGLYPRAVLRRASATWEWLVEGIEMAEGGRTDSGTRASVPATGSKAGAMEPAPAASVSRQAELPLPLIGASPGRPAAAGGGGGGRMIDLESIVADIRSGGARAVSEGPSSADLSHRAGNSAPRGVNGHAANAGADLSTSDNAKRSSTAATAVDDSKRSDLSPHEIELRRRVASYRQSKGDLPWLVTKIERLVSEVGARYAAVSQVDPQVGGQSCTRWTVRGRAVLLGFTTTEDDGYWRRLLRRAADLKGAEESISGSAATATATAPTSIKDAKVVAFTSSALALDRSAWLAKLDSASAERRLDVIELHKDDLALLYAADDMIGAAPGGDTDAVEATVRFVARRMDPFWRRLTRPLSR